MYCWYINHTVKYIVGTVYATSKIYHGDALVYPCTFLTSVTREHATQEFIKKYIFPNCQPKTQKPKLSACILVFLTADVNGRCKGDLYQLKA